MLFLIEPTVDEILTAMNFLKLINNQYNFQKNKGIF